jgi:hypothetical protein
MMDLMVHLTLIFVYIIYSIVGRFATYGYGHIIMMTALGVIMTSLEIMLTA